MENILNHVSSQAPGTWPTEYCYDLFVLHGKHYDRNLLRLLMDGHLLMTCGIILMITSAGIGASFSQGYYVAGVALVSMIVYCFMIFPFLKSIATLLINSLALIILIISLIKK